VRKALAADSEHQYIETVPRRGYRFVAEVVESGEGSGELVVEERGGPTLTLEEFGGAEQAVAINRGTERRRRFLWRGCR
jgi:DNA-binding winged helix-turn-helix (wHTH) protein